MALTIAHMPASRRRTRAGTPKAIDPAGTSRVTTDPDPTSTSSLIVTPATATKPERPSAASAATDDGGLSGAYESSLATAGDVRPLSAPRWTPATDLDRGDLSATPRPSVQYSNLSPKQTTGHSVRWTRARFFVRQTSASLRASLGRVSSRPGPRRAAPRRPGAQSCGPRRSCP